MGKGIHFRQLWELFFQFLKVGLFTFGGGYAMISVITDICVEKKLWMTQDEMLDLTVAAESTPGPIAINCATYVGYKTAGLTGAIAATFGIVLPAFGVICVFSAFLNRISAHPLIVGAFRGIRVGVALLVLDAGISMLQKLLHKRGPGLYTAFGFCSMLAASVLALRISSVELLLAAGVVSLLLFAAGRSTIQKGGAK